MKKKVMIFTGYYLPGVKGGGPIQSIKNLVDNLSDSFDFYIFTRDRDLGDTDPYTNIKINEWDSIGNAKIYYASNDKINFNNFKDIINSISPDTIYINSFFALKFSIIPIILNKIRAINPTKIVVAPRGEFSQGALKLKKQKKNGYIKLSKILKLYNEDNIIWHATSEYEKQDILDNLDSQNNIYISSNFTANYENKEYKNNTRKEKNKLKLVFLSRITPKKNILYAINILKKINKGSIVFDIYGPIEDEDYWKLCKNEISKLPSNIKVRYKGLLQHNNVIPTFENYHFFFFPTFGENFGHVIAEALIGSCPVIISDQTPWKNLENFNIGWDISLDHPEKFEKVIKECLEMNDNQYTNISKKSFNFARDNSLQKGKIKKMIEILDT